MFSLFTKDDVIQIVIHLSKVWEPHNADDYAKARLAVDEAIEELDLKGD